MSKIYTCFLIFLIFNSNALAEDDCSYELKKLREISSSKMSQDNYILSVKKIALKCPSNPAIMFSYILSLIEAGKNTQAIELIEQVEDESLADYLKVLSGRVYFHQGDYKKAYTMFEDAVRAFKNKSNNANKRRGSEDFLNIALHSMAIAGLKLGKTQEAVSMLREVVRNNPTSIEPKIDLGMIFERNGDMLGAKNIYQEAVDLDSFNAEAKIRLALMHASLDEYEKAYQLVQTVLLIAQKDPQIYGGVAKVFLLSKDYTRGVEVLEKAYNKFPNSEEVGVNFAIMLALDGQVDRGFQVLESLLKTYPQSSLLKEVKAWFYLKDGMYEDAKEIYNSAISLSDSSWRVSQNLAVLYKGEGNKKQAKLFFKQAESQKIK